MRDIHTAIADNQAHHTPLTDKSLIKGKDLALLRNLTDYLDAHDLTYEIRGSTRDATIAGRPRTYHDIDLVITKENEGTAPAVLELSAIAAGIPGRNEALSAFTPTTRITAQTNSFYVNTFLDNRFTVHDPRTGTLIDLCFEGKDPIPHTYAPMRAYDAPVDDS